MKEPVREVITQQVVISEIITATDVHSVHVLTRSVLIAATEAAVIARADSALKASAQACRAQMVNIHSSVVAINHVAAMVVHRVVAIITTVPVVISHVSRQVVIVHATTAIITIRKVVTSLVSRVVISLVNRGGGYNNNRGGGYNSNRGGGYRQHTPGYDPNAKYSLKKRIEYKEENFDPTEPLRLNKYLANAGVCSRREADEFIQAGVVTVNGEVVTELGTKILRTDEVKFHDAPVSLEKKVYVLLNKPKDYVTTSDDPQQRKTVMDLVKDVCPERIYPVGRLDRNTTGVLLLTNDGDLASKLTHPKFLKKKVYHVHLDKNITAHDLQQIRDGITLDDGEIKADAVDYADERDKAQVGIEIHSGKNRIVRRIFESLGYRVTKLDRVQFAGLTKKNLRRGDWRFLTEKEVDMLRMGAFE